MPIWLLTFLVSLCYLGIGLFVAFIAMRNTYVSAKDAPVIVFGWPFLLSVALLYAIGSGTQAFFEKMGKLAKRKWDD